MSDRLSQVVALAVLLMAVQVGGGFGPASAEATVVDSATVEIAVTVEGAAGTEMVVHAVDPGGGQRTVAMLETTPGTFRTRFDTRPLDLVVVFEDLETGDQSDPLRLTALGVAPELVGVVPPADTAPEEDPRNVSLLWLAGALGLASLSALAFWVLGGGKPATSEEPEPDRETH